MTPADRQGVEIDYCGECGGVFLDRGELDRLVAEEAAHALRQGQEELMRQRRNQPFDHFATAELPALETLELREAPVLTAA